MYDREVMNPNASKFCIFIHFFVENVHYFSLKIEILKIWKHRHVAEDVCFHIKPSYGHSHAYPLRLVGAICGHPSFSAIQNGRQSAILNLIAGKIIWIVTLTYFWPLIAISGQLRLFWQRYNMKYAKNGKKWNFFTVFVPKVGHFEFFQKSEKNVWAYCGCACLVQIWSF